ncbi:MAG: class I SAM-dependent methyltransferase [Cytophagaceae bacterium]|nr:class I SAM-dependent methyltransferase [Cytophagaceae bacterium]
MSTTIKEREEGHERLYPNWLNPRYYYLTQLRKQLESVTNGFIRSGSAKTLADFGCGNSPYESLILPHVKKYYKIDLEENPRAEIHIKPTGAIAMEDNTVDAVLSTQVLEHVPDPVLYLSESKRILKSDGILILSTHGYWMYHPDPTDYWRWTSSGLKKVVEQQGFEVIYFKGIIGRAAMGLQLFQDGFLFKIPAFLKPVLALFMQPLIALMDKTTSQQSKNSDACTFVLVAKIKK